MMLRMLWQSGLLLALAAAGALATWKWHPQRPELYLVTEQAGPDEITVTEALKLEKGKGVIWIDARTRREFDKGHIPGAFLLNLYEWEDLMVPVIESIKASDEERTVVVYCDSQKCTASREIREKMIGFGLGDLDIRVLHGGWPAWRHARK
jgi:rhodanese-related sulfurtransferase